MKRSGAEGWTLGVAIAAVSIAPPEELISELEELRNEPLPQMGPLRELRLIIGSNQFTILA